MEFLPRLKAYLQKKDVLEHTWFHVSDEPGMKDLDSYRSAVQCMHSGLGDCRFLDALSDFEFYRLGLVEHPVVASDHLEPFLEAEIPDLWTYYCCVQGVDVSNRFLPCLQGEIGFWVSSSICTGCRDSFSGGTIFTIPDFRCSTSIPLL
ncbi:hypothetical protein LC724_28095 [Blautia sp. RD014234]|nr:hypothetical protein [Blautia parvula]